MPSDPVPARVLRIDPAGRFLFARVEPDGFDVYVYHSLFRDVGVREGDQVRLLVETSDRGPRARSLWVEP
jgi:cold shock CspA family protein